MPTTTPTTPAPAIMLLAIDSATRMLSLALHDGARVRLECSWETANRHTVELTPAIQSICARAGVSVQALTHIAVSQGPGSFSGLRIGIGVAKGLALALAVPLIGVPTLDIVAAPQPRFDGVLFAVAEAGRGRIAVGQYTWLADGWQARGALAIVSWDGLLATLNALDADALVAGEIDAAARVLIGQNARPLRLAPPALCLRRAGMLADLALARRDALRDPVTPIYVNPLEVPKL